MEQVKIAFRDLKVDEIEIKKGKGGTLLLYKTARVDANILDETFGTLGWQKLYEEIDGKVYCKIGVRVDGEWIWKMDCGEETAIEAAKGEASDAMKRAGFAFGIGRKLYTSPFIKDPNPNDKYAKYRVANIEFDDTKITSLLVVDGNNQQVFCFGDWSITKANIAKQYLEGNQSASDYYLKKYEREDLSQFAQAEMVAIYEELRANKKV